MQSPARSIALLMLLAVLAAFAFEGAIRIPFKGDVHYPEAAGIAPILLATQGEPLYPDISAGHFATLFYPPAFHSLVLMAAKVFGLGADGISSAGRALATCFAFLAAAFLVLMRGQNLAKASPPFMPVAAFALALSNPLFLRWSMIVRPDTGAIAFSILGLLFGQQALRGVVRSTQVAWVLAAVVAFSIALGMKQTALAAPLTLGLLYWRERNHRALLVLIFSFVAAIFAGFGFLRLFFGPHGISDILATGSAPWSAGNWMRPLHYAFRDAMPHILLLIPWSLASYWASRRWRLEVLSPTGIYLLVSLSFAFLTSGKAGSTMNYYLEPAMIAGVMSERPLAWLLQTPRTEFSARWKHLLGFGCIWMICGNLWLRPFIWHFRRGELRPFRVAQEQLERMGGRYKNGPVLSSDSRISMLAGNRPSLMDPFIFSAMQQSGAWSPEALHQMIRRREFSALVFDFELGKETGPVFQDIRFWPQDTVQIMLENYHLKERVKGWLIYEPKAQ